jgi:N-acetylmuramoyl-L-alanine amidase
MKIIIRLIFLIFILINFSNASEYLSVLPKNGDGIKILFNRFNLDFNNNSVNRFLSLNSGKFGKNNSLFLKTEYQLPIRVYKYNGTSIRSTIGNNDYNYALTLQNYNDLLFSKGIKSENYRINNKLWVPLVKFKFGKSSSDISPVNKVEKLKKFKYDLFGKAHEDVIEESHKLKNRVYYLVAGHGGPDPGAIGKRYSNILHEDEYAYDVILRLAKNLMKHGAKVEIIVQDSSDGIRDDYYLNNSYNEVYLGNQTIPLNQLERLKKRVDIVNEEYRKNKNSIEQIVVPIHVDSRENKKRRIDIFFYHNRNSERGKEIAETLLETIENKYEQAQPGRGYNGSVSARGLYMLRKTIPTTVYIELGNIQNTRDQLRIVEKNNRQAIANWLTDGFLKLAD